MSLTAAGAPWLDLAHGFTGRAGGASAGPYASFNLSFRVGDREEAVRRNWELARAAMPPGCGIALPRQVHGSRIVVAASTEPDLGEADAAISTSATTAVAVLTADCVPILLASANGAVVAAVHAGWRGTAADIAGATVRAFTKRFAVTPDAIHAALGPAIGGCCYEVGDDVIAALRQVPGLRQATEADWQQRRRVDLRRANALLLRAAGLAAAAITFAGPCTRCAADAYFSHRGAGGAATGRQLSWVAPRRAPAPVGRRGGNC